MTILAPASSQTKPAEAWRCPASPTGAHHWLLGNSEFIEGHYRDNGYCLHCGAVYQRARYGSCGERLPWHKLNKQQKAAKAQRAAQQPAAAHHNGHEA